MKRIRWEVIPIKGVFPWRITRAGQTVRDCMTKKKAINNAAEDCRFELESYAWPAELFIKNRNGKIGKGSNGRRTYGKDPRGTKG